MRHYKKGVTCWVTENTVLQEIRVLQNRMLEQIGKIIPVYISTNDMDFIAVLRYVL